MSYNTIIPITEAHLTSSRNRPRHKLIKPKKVVIHYTGNSNKGSNAMATRNYFNNTDRYASAQYNVDDKQIVECMPWWEVAWAVGGSSYTKFGNSLHINGKTPNYSTISIEMCINSDSNYHKVTEYTVSLTVWLLLQAGLTPKDICRHYDITGKQCPYFYLDDKDWNMFKSYVEDVYDDVKYNRPVQIDYKNIFNVQILVDNLNIRKGPTSNYDPITQYNKGKEVIVYEEVEGWYRCDDGWFSASSKYSKVIKEMSTEDEPSITLENAYGMITTDNLNIRSTPDSSNSSNIVGKYHKDQQVTLLEEKDGWYRTDKGWIFAKYVERKDFRENVKFFYNVNIRDINGTLMGVIGKDEKALMFPGETMITGRPYRKIKFGNITGYINPYTYTDIKS